MLSYYLNLNKYDASKDLEEATNKRDLFEYKKQVLITNGFVDLVEALPNTSAKFNKVEFDEDGYEVAVDVDDVYPVSLDDEKSEFKLRAQNLEYLTKVNKTFEFCRTRCKVLDQRLRNFTLYPKENQMCVTDCLNVRTELFNEKRPGEENKEKTFVWLA